MKNLKIFTKVIENSAIEQINLLLEQKAFADTKVRIMPDVHTGKGCVIGFTAIIQDKVIPNIVGVDIGCGMLTVKLGDTNINPETLDIIIHKNVPSGKNVHDGRLLRYPRLQELYCYRNLKDAKRIERSIGSLGGGNHFIELDVDNNGNKYLIIHSGSRNLGKQVAEYYQKLAIEIHSGKDKMYDDIDIIIKDYKQQGHKSEIQNKIKEIKAQYEEVFPDMPDDLCYLYGKWREQYLHDMQICQEFAVLNRETIANIILDGHINDYEYFQTIHNYIELETNIVRKGAIRANENELVLIPINMRDGCILGKGKGNSDWNYSAPHGAGRLMSRTRAKELLNIEDFKNSMKDIYTTSVNNSTLDEAPMAYKSLSDITDNIKDTIDIIEIIKPIYNFKSGE